MTLLYVWALWLSKKKYARILCKKYAWIFSKNPGGLFYNDAWIFKSTAGLSENTFNLYARNPLGIRLEYFPTRQELFSICILAGLI